MLTLLPPCVPPLLSALLLLSGLSGGAAPQEPSAPSTPRALNHWSFEVEGIEESVVNSFASDFHGLVRGKQGARLRVMRDFNLEESPRRLHFMLETVDTRTQRRLLDELTSSPAASAVLKRQDQLFTFHEDLYLRLLSSDPEKEQGTNRRGAIRWTLRTHFPRAAEAAACARAVADHVNANYPIAYVRAYEEWLPSSGRIHIYFFGTGGVAAWVDAEERMRADPELVRIWAEAADAFVEGSFEDRWLVPMLD